MAAKTAKTAPRRIVAEDDDEPLTPSETPEGEEGESEAETPVSVVKAPEPKIEKSGDDIVTFVCYEEVDPAPVVGQYKFRDHNVLKLEKTKTYQMPRDVAMHLVDRKKGTIVSA